MKESKITRRAFFNWFVRGGVCTALGYPILIEPNWLVLEKVDVSIPGLPQKLDGLRIGLLADFHRGLYITESDIKAAIRLLQKQRPDLILLGGDFVEGKADYIQSCAPLLSKLDAPLGTYAVLGNHDYWTDSMVVSSGLKQFHIKVLKNESVELRWNGNKFFLVGLDCAWGGRPNLRKAIKDIPDDEMKILLVHEPDYADKIKNLPIWLPLQLSGHSHGGQVIIPFFGPPYLPYMGKKYPMGLQRISGTNRWVYTTRGIGNVVPVRFNCRPEVTLLTLKQ
jgi:hypothetical protein